MSARKHSPGPWRLYREYPHAITVVDGKVGYRIADVLRYKEASREESDANARLIVSAPELLDALGALVAHHGESATCENCRRAEALISRVVGRSVSVRMK